MFYVTTSEDCVRGSLRYEIDKANRHDQSIIEITPKVCGDIILNSEIKISSNIKIINNAGRDLTISGGLFDERLFHILPSSTRTIFESPSDNKFILTKGKSTLNGGAIYVNSSSHILILDNISIKHNKAIKGGGIYSKGNVILNSSEVELNEALSQGGGIWSENGVLLNDSKIIHNHAIKSGGGIFVDNGNTTLNKSLVTHNKTDGSGGGIVVLTGNLYVQNRSHVDDNEGFDSGGIQMGQGDVYLNNASSASRNKSFDPVQGSGGGGGITITKGNVYIYHGKIIDNVTLGMFSGGIVSLVGDVSIEHSKILRNSNTGPGGGLALNVGNLSVHASIISENMGASLGGGIVNFSPGDHIYINSSRITNNILTNSETIAQTIKAFISVITQNLDNLSKQAEESGGSGGKSLLKIIPEILQKIISNFNQIVNPFDTYHIAGGGIAALLPTNITIINSNIENNSSKNVSEENSPFTFLGGGIFNFSGGVNINNSSVKDNKGVGIWSNDNLSLTKATVQGNTDGGIYMKDGTILESTINKNTTQGNGGGILNNGTLTLLGSQITENQANDGGGIYSTGSLIIFNSEVDNNQPNDIIKV